MTTAALFGAATLSGLACGGGSEFNTGDTGGTAGVGASSSGGSGANGGSGATSGASGSGGSGGSAGSQVGGGSGEGGFGGNSGTSPGGSAGSPAGGVGGGPSCDPSQLPEDDACVIDEGYGIFVSADGDDSGDGSRGAPLKSLATAMTRAVMEGKRVYACSTAGSYEQNVTVGTPMDGVEVLGGFDCGSDEWTWVGEKARIEPVSGVPLRVEGLQLGLLLRDFTIQAPDASTDGGSPHSIAVWLRGSENVKISRSEIYAGAGAEGAEGRTPDTMHPEPASLNGVSGGPMEAGPEKLCLCPDGTQTLGGKGGTPINGAQAGSDGLPDLGGGKGGQPGLTCADGGIGGTGASGEHGVDGQGAPIVGNLQTDGFVGRNGDPGSRGGIGQGGGGGAASVTGGGGGGGCGGCGAPGGLGGSAGGSSIGLLSFESAVELDGTIVVAGSGGRGGRGAGGAQGMLSGGFGGDKGALGACDGGTGGPGGNGGAGGGGAGGLSVAILYAGQEPMVQEPNNLTFGEAGEGGEGGNTSGGNSNSGVPGLAAAVLASADL